MLRHAAGSGELVMGWVHVHQGKEARVSGGIGNALHLDRHADPAATKLRTLPWSVACDNIPNHFNEQARVDLGIVLTCHTSS